ncbi:hypothetical protein A5893_14445 [Pedobacter psychrophilus]|uniref:Methyltransferase FkbM domain-containing protein n=1 Tax=Pedobacter psychrophilus TaxID=1826909 RepID=A0A179DD99_9SPHI|nr:hypothetical protein A5893_14445 [Pedobacter psychrophilus]
MAFQYQEELKRLKLIPRYTIGESNLLHKTISFIDSASLLFIQDELFNKEIYKFKADNSNPYIIDAGANIGLSVIYFKMLYTEAEIVAFEPDNKVFKALKTNVETFSLSNVTLIKKALWNTETTLKFYSEGADGGRIAIENENEKLVEIETTSLRGYLQRKVDLLKIDIEGAETIVLQDCEDLLHNVKNLFVEYHSFTDQNQSLDKLLNILKNAGFRYQIQHIGLFSPHPFINITKHSGMDLQLNIFAYK